MLHTEAFFSGSQGQIQDFSKGFFLTRDTKSVCVCVGGGDAVRIGPDMKSGGGGCAIRFTPNTGGGGGGA